MVRGVYNEDEWAAVQEARAIHKAVSMAALEVSGEVAGMRFKRRVTKAMRRKLRDLAKLLESERAAAASVDTAMRAALAAQAKARAAVEAKAREEEERYRQALEESKRRPKRRRAA